MKAVFYFLCFVVGALLGWLGVSILRMPDLADVLDFWGDDPHSC